MSGPTSDPSLPIAGLPGQALRERFTRDVLAHWLTDSRRRTLALIADLDDTQLRGPRLPGMNPPLWDLGRLAWFAERWIFRRENQDSIRSDADALYDPASVDAASRWDLLLPSRFDTLAYLEAVEQRLLAYLDEAPLSVEDIYFFLVAIFREDMCGEALAALRQTLGYPRPRLEQTGSRSAVAGGPWPGDVEVPGGKFLLGALPGEPFAFDNEKWAHPVNVPSFCIARAAVTQSEFATFVEAGGYGRREIWSAAGWHWRESCGVKLPSDWRHDSSGWLRRDFDHWVPLEPDRPVVHVNWFEAEAYCRWARRRLPSEAEWELVAAGQPGEQGASLSALKRQFPWGDENTGNDRANLDGQSPGCVDVSACAGGDSAFGCRQLIGNVWEWTASDFAPYPGFVRDSAGDRDYSQPHFGTHKVLRGGSWLTRGRLLRNTWRHFARPECRTLWAGFRTCAVES